MDERTEAARFLAALRDISEHEADPLTAPAPRARWVGGRVTAGGAPVVLFRWDLDSSVYGRCWDLDELRSLFDPHDPERLAQCMWESEVDEPPGEGRLLDVDWADGLVEEPQEVRWLGRPARPESRVEG